MKRFLLVLILFINLALLLVQPARAQGVIEAETMQIDIWPEYDRREALVIYRIQLSAQTSLPAQVVLRIPRESVSPFNVAYRDVDNKLYNMQYNTTVEGDWLRITATCPAQEIQFEYYDPRLARTGNQRMYDYRWPGDMKVKNLVFRVQQPVNATAMQISPQKGTQTVEDALTYYSIVVGAVEASTSFSFQISYNKPDDSLSASSLPVKAAEPISANPTGGTLTAENNTLIIGFAVGVALIAIGLFWYFRTTRRETVPAGKRRHVRESSRRSPPPAETGAGVYCHQCGKRSGPGDVFCRACGSRLRHE